MAVLLSKPEDTSTSLWHEQLHLPLFASIRQQVYHNYAQIE